MNIYSNLILKINNNKKVELKYFDKNGGCSWSLTYFFSGIGQTDFLLFNVFHIWDSFVTGYTNAWPKI